MQSSNGALTPAVFHILLALADGERHGYAIAQETERVSDGGVRLGPGTLYGSIQRLLRDGLIEESTRVRRAADDERRRYYKLTAAGRRVLEHETARMSALVTAARAKRVLRRANPA
ncbi:MAG: PadR family transcriptional regulator [Gemmatimonadaceae bacterium]